MTARPCPVCDTPLTRRRDESARRFAKRKTCSAPCAKVLRHQKKPQPTPLSAEVFVEAHAELERQVSGYRGQIFVEPSRCNSSADVAIIVTRSNPGAGQ